MVDLLEKIKILLKFQKQISDISDEKFNIFRICGVNHYEVTHSAILAELLSANSTHQYGTKFLSAFLETLKKEHILADNYQFDLEGSIKVTTEFPVGNGRIDIFIDNGRQCIVIENKIYAQDQNEQLKRYETFATSKYENHILLYLTLFGDEASEYSALDSKYLKLSYNLTIINWLERCIEISAKSPVIRETLIQYINHLKHLTNHTSLEKMNNEIIELLSLQNNIESTFTIGERLNDVKNHLINDVLLPQINTVCNDLGLKLDMTTYDRVNISYSSFIIHNPTWKTFKIGFEFSKRNLRNLIVGIVHIDINRREDETFAVLKGHFTYSNQLWVWSDFPKYPTWNKDAMLAISTGEMKDIFKSEISKIIDLTKNLSL